MKKTKNVVGSIKIKTETSNSSWKSKNSQILITPKSEAGKQVEEKREMKKK
jgi:DNA replication initiation complex subunit (GINS family)